MEHRRVTPDEIAAAEDLGDWRFVLNRICARFRAGSFGGAARLAAVVAEAADAADHHPDIDLRYPGVVRVSLTTHSDGGVTTRDLDLARRISALAAEAGAASDPLAEQAVEIAVGTMDADRIRPFWAAVLGYRELSGRELADPSGIGPPMWFQQMDEPRSERNRFHLDISVPHDVAERRVADALAAGGTLVTDEHARSWWVLADADGNEACISTWQDR